MNTDNRRGLSNIEGNMESNLFCGGRLGSGRTTYFDESKDCDFRAPLCGGCLDSDRTTDVTGYS